MYILAIILLFAYIPALAITLMGDRFGLPIVTSLNPLMADTISWIMILLGIPLVIFLVKVCRKVRSKKKVVLFASCAIAFWGAFFLFSHPYAVINEEHPAVTENFYYYISEQEVFDLPGTPVEDLIKRVGDPDIVEYGQYTYYYLTIVSNEGRHRGISFGVNDGGTISDIYPIEEATFGTNWFCRLPLYSTFASTNLFNCASSYSTVSFIRWSPFLLLLMLCAAMYFSMHTINAICLIRMSDSKKSYTAQVQMGASILAAIISYLLLLPWLNVTHSIWLISIVAYVFLVLPTFIVGWQGAEGALDVCPSCKKVDSYSPKKQVFKTERLPDYTVNISANGVRSQAAAGNYIADKLVTFKIWHRMAGKCKHCGYEDTTEYWRTEVRTYTGTCPFCDSKLLISRSNIELHKGTTTSRNTGEARMDMRTADHISGETYRGDVTQNRQTITSRWIGFTYSERCPHCSYSFGPTEITNYWDDVFNQQETRRRTGRVPKGDLL